MSMMALNVGQTYAMEYLVSEGDLFTHGQAIVNYDGEDYYYCADTEIRWTTNLFLYPEIAFDDNFSATGCRGTINTWVAQQSDLIRGIEIFTGAGSYEIGTYHLQATISEPGTDQITINFTNTPGSGGGGGGGGVSRDLDTFCLGLNPGNTTGYVECLADLEGGYDSCERSGIPGSTTWNDCVDALFAAYLEPSGGGGGGGGVSAVPAHVFTRDPTVPGNGPYIDGGSFGEYYYCTETSSGPNVQFVGGDEGRCSQSLATPLINIPIGNLDPEASTITGTITYEDEDGQRQTEPITLGVSIEAPGEDTEDSGEPAVTPDPTCQSSIGNLLGWLLCPISEFFLDSLEAIVRDGVVRSVLNFDALDGETSQRAALESIWTGFRAIANVGFVIAFFVMIYSAASGGVLSAYDVKRLAPKLVFGAILVQMSFFICIQLVAIFNALGESVVSLMLSPLGGEGNAGTGALFNDDIIGWNILGDAIEGLVSVIIIILIIIASIFSIAGVMLMVVVFILRNMALMVLTVVSPLAFVAWILPNTENLFKKWWGFYIQLLALFPIAMAFLASGRLVSFVWASGDGGWANQWIGLIALFTPYIIAPKLFSLAGSAVNGIVRAAEGARDGVKQRGGRLRQSQFGQRAEENAKAKAAGAVNKRWGEGGSRTGDGVGRMDRVAGRLARTGMAQRATAQAQQAKRSRQNSDKEAAQANVDANRSNARLGYNGETGDAAEVQYLQNLLAEGSGATEAEMEAAVSTLLNVHGTRGDAVEAVSDFVKRQDDVSKGKVAGKSDSERASAGALRGRVIEQNKGNLSAIPQIAKPNSQGTVDGMDARELHSLKGGAVEHFADDHGAAMEIARRSSSAVASGSTEAQMVRDGNVSKLRAKVQAQMDAAVASGDAAGQAQAQQVIDELNKGFEFNADHSVRARKGPNSNPDNINSSGGVGSRPYGPEEPEGDWREPGGYK